MARYRYFHPADGELPALPAPWTACRTGEVYAREVDTSQGRERALGSSTTSTTTRSVPAAARSAR